MKLKAETMIQQIQKTVHLNYLVSVPLEAAEHPLRKFPLIIFLHGMGERGQNLEQIKIYGIPKVVEESSEFPFVTISPQCPPDTAWWYMFDGLDHLLVQAVTRYPVDLDRIYLTGLSMGGFGVWSWAAQYPERFAAIAPICGGGPGELGFPERVCLLKNLPVWAFHGAQDRIVAVEKSQSLVDKLQECGGKVRLTIYPELGHNSWDITYANPELYHWFLSHKRGQPAPETKPAEPSQ